MKNKIINKIYGLLEYRFINQFVFRIRFFFFIKLKGLKENIVIVRHALRNSILPVITVAGLLVGTLLGGIVIVETVFAIPGMGQMMITAVNSRDYPLLQS